MPFESTVGTSDLVIGQEYFGSIVVRVKQEVTDDPENGKYKIKRFVTLKTGMILIEEYVKTMGSGKVENKEYGNAKVPIDDTPKDDSDARAKARALIAANKKKKDEEKDKKKKKKKKEPNPELEEIYDVPAMVVPESLVPETIDDNAPVMGVWSHNDDTDDRDWDPMDVVITEEPPSFLGVDEPHGVVAMEKGAKKPRKSVRWGPDQIKFFAPEEQPPDKYETVGYWTPKEQNQSYPPINAAQFAIPTDDESDDDSDQERVVPDYHGEFAKIVPKDQVPHTQEDGAPLTGVWDDGTDDNDWEPMYVDITTDPDDLDPDGIHGIVAVKEGSQVDEYGDLDPSDLKFFPPEKDPPYDYLKVGHWVPAKEDQEWPPKKPKPRKRSSKSPKSPRSPGRLGNWTSPFDDEPEPPPKRKLPEFDNVPATVVPRFEAPASQGEDEDDPLTGVWKHNDDTDDTDWDPVDVIITKEPPSFVDEDDPHGIVAVKEGVEPNEDGKINPKDLSFFTPGEEPPHNYEKVGHWMPSKLNQGWPPIGTTLPDIDGPAKVVPESKAPMTLGENDPQMGVWKHTDDTDDTDWDEMDVIITEDPPSFLGPDEPHGIVAVESGVQPNSVGKLDPADLAFFTPGSNPPQSFNKVGHWSPEVIDQKWPPVTLFIPDLEGPAIVTPECKAPYSQGEDEPQHGVWKHNDDTDDADWVPMDVIISKEPVTFLEPGEPHGICAVKDGWKPNVVGKLKPEDLAFFTPGEEPPAKYNKVGHWRPGKLNQGWPPTTMPDIAGPARVVPKSKAPYRVDENSPLTGLWKHNDGTDDADWDPIDVIITKEPCSFLDEGEPHGIVTIKDGAKLNNVGKLDPKDLEFFTPGEEPSPKISKADHWHWRPGKLNQDWPPVSKKEERRPSRKIREYEKPTLATFDGAMAKVVPKSKAHERSKKDPPLVGVWEHNDDEVDDSNWQPINVVISKDPPSDLEDGDFTGIVAVEEGVKPDKAGKLDPSDLKFFTPSEEPPPNFNKVGHWRPQKLKAGWPPVQSSSSRSLRNVGKLNLPNFDGIPETGVVYPPSQVPGTHGEEKDVIAKGTWKWSKPENKPNDAETWMPSHVELYENGDEPHDWDDKKTHGDWGVNPDAEPGHTKPSDLWFYPPGEKPDEDFEPIGKWRPSKKLLKTEWSWPPKSVGKVSDTREFKEFQSPVRRVGKLKIPGIFK